MCARARHYMHSLPFEFIWHDASGVESDLDAGGMVGRSPTIGRARDGGIFGQSVAGEILHSISSPARSHPSCVLFAYFVLRTRRIRPGHFRHVCLPACAPAHTGISTAMSMQPGSRPYTYFRGKTKKGTGEMRVAHCLLLLARARGTYLRFCVCARCARMYVYVCQRGASRRVASVVTSVREWSRLGKQCPLYIAHVGIIYFTSDSGINSLR